MSGHRTSDEVRNEYIEKMGPQLGADFHALWQDLTWLYVKWGEYVELFGTSPERVNLLNQAASNLFGIIQSALLENIIVHATRLTDPLRSAGKGNLTICLLPGQVATEIDGSINRLIEDACECAAPCRDWRNRRIAHTDRALALEVEVVRPLEAVTRENLRRALNAIGEVLSAVSEHYCGSPIAFEHTIPALSGAESLFDVLATGLTGNEQSES